MITAIIIDDEKPARDLIKAYMNHYHQIEVTAECANGFEGLKEIMANPPDLLFLDIKMPKISGLEMLELIEKPPVTIFSTAFDEYAIKAFDHNAVDYLLKPYSEVRFREAVNKALEKLSDGEATAEGLRNLSALLAKEIKIERIVVKNGARIQIIPLKSIQYFEAQDDYVAIYSGMGKFLKQMTLQYLEDHLPTRDFVRIHRSYILHIGELSKIEPLTKDSYIVVTKNGVKLPLSRAGYKKLRIHLGL
ncbi:MAG: LytTR family transcriptional regulator DNA-binding domain-containing protein [Cyclobacteriaceae bacterium]|nr:LytTR family transcriptional regulator DNA-binding domain-containing protein [Cyclobacteriaceae bacterium]